MKWWREKWRWFKSLWQKSPTLNLTIEDNHPLCNDLILMKIYNHLEFSDKKSFRLVCKTWLECSLRHWRKESKFVIKGKSRGVPVDLLCNTSEEEDDCFQKKSNFYKELEYPVLNLAIAIDKEIFLKNKQIFPVVDKEQILKITSKRFRHSLEYLELLAHPFVQKAQFAEYFAQLLQKFPKLKTLTIEPVILKKPGISLEDKESCKPANNLKTLNIDLDHASIGADGAKAILNLMPNIKKLPKWPNLEKLTFLPDHQQFWDPDLSRHNYKNLIHGYTGSVQLALSEQKRVGWRLGDWESSLGGEFSRGVYN